MNDKPTRVERLRKAANRKPKNLKEVYRGNLLGALVKKPDDKSD